MTDVATALQKWKRNLTGSTQTMKESVQAMTRSPMTAAIAKKAEYVQGVQRAADDGTWEAGLRSVSLDSWKNSMLNKGIPRIAVGVEQASGKMENFLTQLLPYTEKVKQEIAQMPKGTLEQGIQRAVAAIQKMASFKYQRRTS